ncbi:hypothetical protein SBY92_002474 [Candida maltosa Xu316]
MSVQERVAELQQLFNENEVLINNNCSRLNELKRNIHQDEILFGDIRNKLIVLLGKLRSTGSSNQYGQYLQDIATSAKGLESNEQFNEQLNNVFKSFQQ